ncbi:MATE family efflux transporter [Marinomonas sp.]|nr:MATE family efflux transporter [Marinomonas sp.]MDB4836966.1 MATE family efflux transporter [Marinomonas sp.]
MTGSTNFFLVGSMPSVILKTAAPIILMMLVNGSFSLVDAYFLGKYVGANALTAVTSVFPAFMLLVALSNLVSSGFSSVQARLLGANKKHEATEAFAQAISLSLLVCLVLIFMFIVGGHELIWFVNNGSESLSAMSYDYLSLMIFFSPLLFILNINGDTLRSEGKMAFIAIVPLLSVLLNVIFNYILIALMGLGVVGSVYGTLLAQALSLLAIYLFRQYQKDGLMKSVIRFSFQRSLWKDFLALGAPASLTYMGVALSSAAILYNLQIWSSNSYDVTVAAYGITTRLMTFIFLPLLGLSIAFQTILGNNIGAKEWLRSNSTIKIILVMSLIYCVFCQLFIFFFQDQLGLVFVDSNLVNAEVARILPIMTLALFLLGPLMMVGVVFQAIGDAKRAAILRLVKLYFFTIPLIFLLPMQIEELGVWLAGPISEVMALLLTIGVLYQRYRSSGEPMGLFFKFEKL